MRDLSGGGRLTGDFPLYETSREPWLRPAALSIIVLALLAALAVFQAYRAAFQGQGASALEARLRGELQEHNMREEVLRLSRDLLTVEKLAEPRGAKLQKWVADRLKEVEGELARLDQERQKIRAEAEAAGSTRETGARRQLAFLKAALLLLAGLTLATASGVMHKKLLWLSSLILGFIGLIFLVNGYFLWF
jgi:hypothetical protein